MNNKIKKHYKTGVFDSHEWSAPIYKSSEEIFKVFDKFQIKGKKLKQINAIGAACSFESWALNELYVQTQLNAGLNNNQINNHNYEFLNNALVPCAVTVCEPLVLIFEDETTLEILPSGNGTARIGKNLISVNIVDGTNHSNFSANMLFSHILKGLKVDDIAFELFTETTETHARYGGEYISNVTKISLAL